MWPSIRRFAGWAPRPWPFGRPPARLSHLSFGYERAGLSVSGQPVPWTADCAWVLARVHFAAGAARRKDDFSLHLPGQPSVPPVSLRRLGSPSDGHEVLFRVAPPGTTVTARLDYRGRLLSNLLLPHQSREEFLSATRLRWQTPLVRLGMETVHGSAFVGRQCRGLLVSAVLEAAHALVPLLDERLEVEFRCERTGAAATVPVCLSPGQLRSCRALVTAVAPRRPRRSGVWSVTWRVGQQVLLRHGFRCVSEAAFHRSLRIADACFVVQEAGGQVRRAPQAPASLGTRAGPCFLLRARRGVVGLCRVEVRGLLPRGERGPVLAEQQVRVGDGPALVAPGTLASADLAHVVAFEISVAGRIVGVVPLRPVPEATFTGEGGYHAPPEYPWGAAAEEELTERLNRLIEGPP